jgi:hypothetical protein
MPLPPARYELIDWPAGPQVEYDGPSQTLGWFLSHRNMTLELERTLAVLRREPEAWSADNATFADRRNELIAVGGDWDNDKEFELPFAEFCSAAVEFLDWIRSGPPAGTYDRWVVFAARLAGAIEVDEELERLLIAELGPVDAPETVVKLAWTLATSVANRETDPRVGAAAIAQLAPLTADVQTKRAQLIQPFVELAAAARDAEGRPLLVADIEHRIAAAAALLWATGRP